MGGAPGRVARGAVCPSVKTSPAWLVGPGLLFQCIPARAIACAACAAWPNCIEACPGAAAGEEGERIRGGVLGLGLLLGAGVFAHAAACGCRKAEILAINDDGGWAEWQVVGRGPVGRGPVGWRAEG